MKKLDYIGISMLDLLPYANNRHFVADKFKRK